MMNRESTNHLVATGVTGRSERQRDDLGARAALRMNITCAQTALTDEEVKKIMAIIGTFPRRDQTLVDLALTTGLRISSLLALTVGQVWSGGDVRTNFVLARNQQKGSRGPNQRSVKSRVIALSDRSRSLIREYLFERYGANPPATAPLFVSRERRVLSRRQATHRLRQIMRSAEITERIGFGWHACRRWFGSTAYNRATTHDILTTSNLLGHASLQATIRYITGDPAITAKAYLDVAALVPRSDQPAKFGEFQAAYDRIACAT